jgi:hypothetical protein
MLNEDGLLVVVALLACALVTLGTLELVWPTRPRRPRRRPSSPRDPYRRARTRPVPPAPDLPSPAPPSPLPVVAAAVSPEAEPDTPTSPAVVPVASPAAPPEPRPGERPRRAPTRRRPESTEPAPAASSPIAAASAETSPPVEPEGSAVDRAFALVAVERFDEAATLARQALAATKRGGVSAPTVDAARERARLWGVVGLARKGLGDADEARFAFEEAMALAPRGERETWEGHLVALILSVGRRSLDGVDDESRPERIVSLRAAVEWLERGLVVAPDDTALIETLAAVREAIWPAQESVLEALIQRRQFAEARRVLDELMADPECPPERLRALRRLLHRTSRGEAQAAVEAAGHRAT